MDKILDLEEELIDLFNKQEKKWYNDLQDDSNINKAIDKAKKFTK